MSRLYVIYDDSEQPSYEIESIIGNKTFGQITFKRKSMAQRFSELFENYRFAKIVCDIDFGKSLAKIIERVNTFSSDSIIYHAYSEFAIIINEEFDVILKKAPYLQESIFIESNEKIVGILFKGTEDYIKFLKLSNSLKSRVEIHDELNYDRLRSKAFVSLDNVKDFMTFITSGFDARYFNSLNGDEYTVTKSSKNKRKIRSEYQYYQMLPEEMKYWFVLPYNYEEKEDVASYTMERLHMTDIALRWVHGAISQDEFHNLLKKTFYFIDQRSLRNVSEEVYEKKAQELYINKVENRIDLLKESEFYITFKAFVEFSTKYNSIDEIVAEYKSLYYKMRAQMKFDKISVIGHGDLCFSNMLYNKDTATLKLIDTKGALDSDEMWTDPYYDIAKLSHSICGRYDFFNNGLYDITLGNDLNMELTIEFDNSNYMEIFKRYLEEYSIDYQWVRILETSLFLSMLPLHLDYPQKVFGFILNAIKIIEEIKDV